MRNGFQTFALRRVAEHARPHSSAIQAAVGVENVTAKFCDQLRQRGRAGLDHIACNLIGVQHRNALFSEHIRDGALAAGNTASQCDQQRTSFIVHVAAV